jgi:hypothetical protein
MFLSKLLQTSSSLCPVHFHRTLKILQRLLKFPAQGHRQSDKHCAKASAWLKQSASSSQDKWILASKRHLETPWPAKSLAQGTLQSRACCSKRIHCCRCGSS